VEAVRINGNLLSSPLAISKFEVNPVQDTRPQLSLQEYLGQVPGLFALNSQNYAQDLRISIRGFGARSAFGIRGVKIIVDGIPETTPDGQGQVDNLTLGMIQNIEVIKGAASMLYGNASGGVVQINTPDSVAYDFWEVGSSYGQFTYFGQADSIRPDPRNWHQHQFKAGLRRGATHFLLHGNYTQSDGYRIRSGVKQSNWNARILHRFSPKAKLSWQVNYTDSPQADDPGGIALEAVEANRTQARDRNLSFAAGESIQQFKTGVHYQHTLGVGSALRAYTFYSNRTFEGLLPFSNGGWIELNRHYFGQGASWQKKQVLANGVHQFRVGYEWASQSDARERFFNLEGIQGDMVLNQNESFGNVGLYVLDQLTFEKLVLNLGLRYDWNRLKVTDEWLVDGDDSGKINLSALSPSLGFSYQWQDNWWAYANYRSGFETPTLSELSANPSGGAGFNADLTAQRANNVEFGIKGKWNDRLFIDLTGFYIRTNNELVPFELEAFPERSFFRNAGSTDRLGLEWSSRLFLTRKWSLLLSYTYSNFEYRDYDLPDADLSGLKLPGIPPHFAAFSIERNSQRGLNFRLQGRYNGQLWLNDSNELQDDAYFLLNTSLGYRLVYPKFVLTPFLGLNNLTNTEYNDNIRINAFGRRFFEPGPRLNFYLGLRFRWGRSGEGSI
ncbi:MAG: TonB-dependent receptor, partial [Bacteroidota bacterium]